MDVTGKGERGFMFVAEAPGQQEDEDNTQLVGPAGQELREELAGHMIDLDEDAWKINAINCRPTDSSGRNRPPTGNEIVWCRPMVLNAIRKHHPRVIIPLGTSAVQSVLGHTYAPAPGGIGLWRGWRVPDQTLRAWICPTYHPSFILRQEDNDVSRVIWRRDLHEAITLARNQVDVPRWEDECDCIVLRNTEEVCTFVKSLLAMRRTIAFDYETTGLKHQAPGHEIVAVGVSLTPLRGVGFRLSEEVMPLWKRVLADPAIRKIAHNLQIEDSWGHWSGLNAMTRGWVWDTMLGSKVIDNRRGAHGLKFQTYVRLGIRPYDEATKPFLTGQRDPEKPSWFRDTKLSANAYNQVLRTHPHDLLHYVAMDAAVTRWHAQFQVAELRGERGKR
jgi:uracil-DNA glycosylase family 4